MCFESDLLKVHILIYSAATNYICEVVGCKILLITNKNTLAIKIC